MILNGINFLLPIQLTQTTTAVEYICHYPCLQLLILNYACSVFCSGQLRTESLILCHSQFLPPSNSSCQKHLINTFQDLTAGHLLGAGWDDQTLIGNKRRPTHKNLSLLYGLLCFWKRQKLYNLLPWPKFLIILIVSRLTKTIVRHILNLK